MTLSGFTAQKISNLRPNCSILACCPSNHIAEKVDLNFGVEPIVVNISNNTDEMVEEVKKIAEEHFSLQKGDLIIVTGGFPLGKASVTNSVRIVEI